MTSTVSDTVSCAHRRICSASRSGVWPSTVRNERLAVATAGIAALLEQRGEGGGAELLLALDDHLEVTAGAFRSSRCARKPHRCAMARQLPESELARLRDLFVPEAFDRRVALTHGPSPCVSLRHRVVGYGRL